MKPGKFFNAVYYLNNTVFSFLLIQLIIDLVVLLLQKTGLTAYKLSFSTSIYNVVCGYITNLLILFALYQSFLALNNVKRGYMDTVRWQKHFSISGVLFCIASLTNLLNIETAINKEALNKFSFFYTSDEYYAGFNGSSLFIMAIGILLLFISSLKYSDKNNL